MCMAVSFIILYILSTLYSPYLREILSLNDNYSSNITNRSKLFLQSWNRTVHLTCVRDYHTMAALPDYTQLNKRYHRMQEDNLHM